MLFRSILIWVWPVCQGPICRGTMVFKTWSTSELWVRLAQWKRFKPSCKIFLLTVPRRYFFCGSFMLFLYCVCYAFVRVCFLMPCGHLLGKDWPLGSGLWCLIVSLLLSHWYSESGVVLDCIDSWSLPSFYFTAFTVYLLSIFRSSWFRGHATVGERFTERTSGLRNG